ncbi:MAG: peptidoglycan-associated lipoprotein [Deltaproteobacteria bacterium RBG_16_47_11]|nr:MAG: peptidoglycan-associated lipoprotein [Deltaproteobacteria bacterium RBG_16_47_11]
MSNRSFSLVVIIVCLGLVLGGCPKKTVVKDEPFSKKVEEMTAAAEREKAARLEAERKEKEAKELARIKEEEAQRALAEKTIEAEKQRIARVEAERALKEKERQAQEEAARSALAEKELQAETEMVARLEAERKEREAKELARVKEEEEARKALFEKELEAEKERIAKLQAERELKEKELKAIEEAAKRAQAEEEKRLAESLVARKDPGIEGQVFESSLLKDIHFDFDRYDVRPENIEILRESATLLLKHPKVKIQIEGHCDERGTHEYNLALGERRANSARQYLISLGIAGDRISTISYGQERPADPGHHEEAWAKNRRAHFVILSK